MKLLCCTTHMAPGPGGWKRVHSKYCKANPNQFVTAGEIDAAIKPKDQPNGHPAGQDLPVGGISSVRIYLAHCQSEDSPLGDGCPHCLYVDHHIDDSDDVQTSGAFL